VKKLIALYLNRMRHVNKNEIHNPRIKLSNHITLHLTVAPFNFSFVDSGNGGFPSAARRAFSRFSFRRFLLHISWQSCQWGNLKAKKGGLQKVTTSNL